MISRMPALQSDKTPLRQGIKIASIQEWQVEKIGILWFYIKNSLVAEIIDTMEEKQGTTFKAAS